MAETSVLAELMFEVVPMWCGKLEKYIKEAEDAQKPTSGIIITPPGVDAEEKNTPKVLTPGMDGAAAPPSIAPADSSAATDKGKTAKNKASQLKKSMGTPHGICRLDAKPDTSKTRFSSLTGPVVMYDGESQHMLSELWTSLNNKRGGLRKEMMALKRRQELSAPRMMPNIEVDSETEGISTGKEEEEDLEQSSELLRLRLKMEREKMKRMNRRTGGIGGGPVGVTPLGALSFKRARTMAGPPVSNAQAMACAPSGIDDQRLKTLLEGIDDNLDKACKVTETVAFIWLKGDAYQGHLKFIVGRLKEILAKIGASGFVPPKRNEETAATTASPATDSKEMPPPSTPSSRPLMRKKSDATMRDACAVSLVAASTSNAEHPEPPATTIPAAIEVGSIKDELTPEILASMLATGKAPEEPCYTRIQPRANSLDPEVIEVEDDDEGVVC